MTKRTPTLTPLPRPSDNKSPFSEEKSSPSEKRWKPQGPITPPNSPIFLEETAAQAAMAASMEMDRFGEIVNQFIAQDEIPPFTLRQTLFFMTAMSLGAEMMSYLARQRKAEMAPTLFGPEGRPL